MGGLGCADSSFPAYPNQLFLHSRSVFPDNKPSYQDPISEFKDTSLKKVSFWVIIENIVT